MPRGRREISKAHAGVVTCLSSQEGGHDDTLDALFSRSTTRAKHRAYRTLQGYKRRIEKLVNEFPDGQAHRTVTVKGTPVGGYSSPSDNGYE